MRSLAEDGTAIGPAESEPDLAAAVSARGRDGDVRWVWQSAAALYPALLQAGVRATRCHDIQLAEGLLVGRDGPARDGLLTAAVFPTAVLITAGPATRRR